MIRALAEEHPPKVSLTIVCPLLKSFCIRKKEDDVARHIEKSETPLALELSMKVHMRTCNESLVNMLAERGLSISYDHLNRLKTALINSVITLWEQIVEVVHTQAIRGKFATIVIDKVNNSITGFCAAGY